MTEFVSIKKSLDKQGKSERRFYAILSAALYILGAFAFWGFVYDLCNMIGAIVSGTPSQAIVQLMRILPRALTAFALVYLAVACISLFRARSADRRIKGWKINGIASIAVGAVIALYVIIGVITGRYNGFVEGFVSPLFPLDSMAAGLAIAVYGAFSILYSARLARKGTKLPARTDKRCGFRRVIEGILYTLAYSVSLCGFAACVYGTYVMDWTHGGVFFNIMLWLNYFTAVLMFVAYRYCYLDAEDGCQKPLRKWMGLGFLVLNSVLFGLYLLSVKFNIEAPNLNAFGILPIDFTASVNAFMAVYALMNLVSPLAAFLKGLGKNK